jgi:hypothetical protein
VKKIDKLLDRLNEDTIKDIVNKAINSVCHKSNVKYSDSSREIISKVVFEVLSELQKKIMIKPRK